MQAVVRRGEARPLLLLQAVGQFSFAADGIRIS